MIRQSSQDFRSQLTELKRRLAASMADEQRLYQRFAEASREAERWSRRAELAVDRGSDDLARAALERSRRHSAEAHEYRRQYLEQKGHVEGMKRRLLDLERGVTPLPGRLEVAALERSLARLETWEDRAREQRARLAAMAELERDELAEKLAALEQEDRLERDLAALKARHKAQGTGRRAQGEGVA